MGQQFIGLTGYVAEKVHHLPGARQTAQISVDASPSVVFPRARLDNKIIGQTTGGFKIFNIFG